MKYLRLYSDPQILRIALLGISSSIPFFCILSTLSIRLIESGVSKTVIGMIAWITIPYAFKFLLAPFMERTKVFLLYKILGKRRSWLLLSQILIMIFLAALSDPAIEKNADIVLVSIYGIAVAMSSAVQDITIEAYRIEILPRRLIGYGSAASSFGYRLGTLIAGALALYIAHIANWQVAYIAMAGFMLIGIITTLCSPEPGNSESYKKDNIANTNHFIKDSQLLTQLYNYTDHVSVNIKSSWREIVSIRRFLIVLGFLFLIKIGDTVLHALSGIFLLDIGFSKMQVAYVDKTFGLTAMLVGSLMGGIVITKLGLKNAFILSTNLLIASSVLFIIQASLGNNLYFLFAVIGLENFACGISQVSLLSYMSHICYGSRYIATKFALLSSFSSVFRVIITTMFFSLAQYSSWTQLFAILSICCCLPFAVMWFVPFKRINGSNYKTKQSREAKKQSP